MFTLKCDRDDEKKNLCLSCAQKSLVESVYFGWSTWLEIGEQVDRNRTFYEGALALLILRLAPV